MRWFGVEDINLNEADNSVKLLGWPQDEGGGVGEGEGEGSFAVCVFAHQHVCPLAYASGLVRFSFTFERYRNIPNGTRSPLLFTFSSCAAQPAQFPPDVTC